MRNKEKGMKKGESKEKPLEKGSEKKACMSEKQAREALEMPSKMMNLPRVKNKQNKEYGETDSPQENFHQGENKAILRKKMLRKGSSSLAAKKDKKVTAVKE